MRGLRAALGKDLKLFRSGAGFLCLLLPLVLLLALRSGSGDLLRQAYIEPFPIAVRDEDATVMSRSLTSQIARVELFSDVVPGSGRSDEALLKQGCAAVVTIPKDFFYTMYRMDNQVVQVALNDAMPLEAGLFRSVFTSVMEIISADQAAAQAVFRFCYGSLSPEQESELWEETSQRLVADALTRQQIFDGDTAAADLKGSLESSFLACVLSVLCLFFPIAAVKTLPEELHSGILPRFLAAGGRLSAFCLSKFLTAALLAAPSLALLLAAFRPEHGPLILLLAALLFFRAFGLLLLVSAAAAEESATQRWGNLILLVSLMLGGALYPQELLPAAARLVGRLTLPFCARQGLDMIQSGGGVPGLLGALWPSVLAGVFSLLAAAAVLGRGRPRGRPTASESSAAAVCPVPPLPGTGNRLAAVTVWKVRAMSGGAAGLVCLLLITGLCGLLAGSALNSTGPDQLHLVYSVENAGPLARELTERVASLEGVSLQQVSPEQGRALLNQGRAEGFLLLGADYDQKLLSGCPPELHYESAGPAVTAQAAREMIAGQVRSQLARLRGLQDAQRRLGRSLTPAEEALLLTDLAETARSAPALYKLTGQNGTSPQPAALLAPSQLGFALLAVVLTLFTWAAWTGRPDVRQVERRVLAVSGSRWLSYCSDVLALFFIGLAAGLCALLPGGARVLGQIPALAAGALCLTGLSLVLVRKSALQGRMDALAPFVALITCLAGGCFGTVSQFSPALRTLSLLTPQGLALRAGAGEVPPLAILAAAGTVLLCLGAPPREPKGADLV